MIDQFEFRAGLKKVGVSLPDNQFKDIWALADQDGSGYINYGEFCKKFSVYKASKALTHDGEDAKFKGAHIMDDTKGVQFGVDGGVGADKVAKAGMTRSNTYSIDQKNLRTLHSNNTKQQFDDIIENHFSFLIHVFESYKIANGMIAFHTHSCEHHKHTFMPTPQTRYFLS